VTATQSLTTHTPSAPIPKNTRRCSYPTQAQHVTQNAKLTARGETAATSVSSRGRSPCIPRSNWRLSRWYEPTQPSWAKCQLKPCMRTLFPRHWDPAPRCNPGRAIGLAGRRVCHCVVLSCWACQGMLSPGDFSSSSRLGGGGRALERMWHRGREAICRLQTAGSPK
jgi:hypothetical protein